MSRKNVVLEFFQFAKDHRIKTDAKQWYKGIFLLLVGWGLIGVNQELFNSPINSYSSIYIFLVQFFFAMVVIVLFGVIHQKYKHGVLNPLKYFSITKENEISGAAIISTKERKVLIYIRGAIAALGYIAFQLAKVAIGGIDNAVIYSADSLMYALISWSLLKVRYNTQQVLGILLVSFGVFIILFLDITTSKYTVGILGYVMGLTSTFSLAIILVLTSVILQHDYPTRLAFYQNLLGFLFSLLVFFVFFIFNPLDLIYNIKQVNIIIPMIEGMSYAIALLCFFQAFYYVNPLIVAISSYTLDIYSVVLNAVFSPEDLNIHNLGSSLLIAIGAGILLREDYKEDKLKKNQKDLKK